MKTELNEENRAKFCALYYGQEVWLRKKDNRLFDLDGESIDCNDNSNGLLLKSLSSITDEDASILAEQNGVTIGSHIFDDWKNLAEFKNNISDADCWPVSFFDYLRSKSYALPYMDLSVEEMASAGWIILKED